MKKSLYLLCIAGVLLTGCKQNNVQSYTRWYYDAESDSCISFCNENRETYRIQKCEYGAPIILYNSTHTTKGLQKEICKNCGHEKYTATPLLSEHNYNQKNTDQKFKKTETCCTTVYFYSCECGACGAETFFVKKDNPESHNFDEGVVLKESSHLEEGILEKTCLNCGEKKVVSIPKKSEHNFTIKNIDEKYLVSETSCLYRYYYSCECGEHGTETFDIHKVENIKHENVKLIDLNVCSDNIKNPAIFKCIDCGKEFVASIHDYDIGLPVIDFCGDFSTISKENKIHVSCVYSSADLNFECDATLKYQGNFSLGFPKRNYSVQFFKKNTNFDKKMKIELFEGCGEQSKYCLKADYVDPTHLRNLVGADLSRKVVFNRNIDDEISALPNGGVTNGYPLIMYQNNGFYGLYNLTIPKDKWMYQMDTDIDARQAIVSTEAKTAGIFSEPANYDYTNGLDLEFCSTEDSKKIDDSWVVDSFNNITSIVLNSSDTDFKTEIIKYVDVPRTIDVILITLIGKGWDNVSHNVLWTTYDGIKWNPNMYDMDNLFSTGYSSDYDINLNQNVLYKRICNNYHDELVDRFNQLCNDVFYKENIKNEFEQKISKIPYSVYFSDGTKWNRLISETIYNSISETLSKNIEERIAYLKKYF